VRREKHVTWYISPFGIRRERNAYDGRYSATVEGVTLDDNDGPPISGA
jgi:hypothetical protein